VQAVYDDGSKEIINEAFIEHPTLVFGENSATFSWRGKSGSDVFNTYYPGDTDFDGTVNVTDVVCSLDAITNETELGIGMVAADVDKNSRLNVTDIVKQRKIIFENN
jgi:hypothetical protein